MTEQQYRVVADRDKGDDPQHTDVQAGDRYTLEAVEGFPSDDPVVRIERPVPIADDTQKPELVTMHLYRDTCVGGLFLSERELDRTLHEHVEALTIRRDRLPSPHPPTHEQIAPLPEDARMDAYYYGFERTGVGFIDAILSAVAIAGKGAHHTESWGADPWEGTPGYFRSHPGLPDADNAVDLIQGAAQQAADAVLALIQNGADRD